MMCAPQNPVVIAVTGGIACGKSEVGRILEQLGFSVYDADHVAHDLMKKGTSVYQRVLEFFGVNILSDNGEISRPKLGKEVFENPEKLEALNRLVHPAVEIAVEEQIKDALENKRNIAVLVPLLFESGMDSLKWSAIVCISSQESLITRRLKARGFGEEETRQRISSQLPLKKKEQLSDHVIHNNGSLEELEESTRETVRRIMSEEVL